MSPRLCAAGLLVLAMSACKRPPAAADAASDASAVTIIDTEPPPRPATVADFTPDASASLEERKRALAALLAGASPARELAEQATDPDAGFDNGLRQRLTTVEVADPGPALGSTPTVRGDVRMGGSTATVKIDNADRVLAGMRPRLRKCYEAGLAVDPTMTGKLTLTANVSPAGEVTAGSVTANTGLSPAVAACARKTITLPTFDAPGGSGSVVTVTVEMVPSK